jgi:hypothetical protein
MRTSVSREPASGDGKGKGLDATALGCAPIVGRAGSVTGPSVNAMTLAVSRIVRVRSWTVMSAG